jgi:hypothetical protein
MNANESSRKLVVPVRAAIAAHLDMDVNAVTPTMTLGSDLGMDSLDVFSVVEDTARRSGQRITLNYRDPRAMDMLGGIDTITVEDFAACLVVTSAEFDARSHGRQQT